MLRSLTFPIFVYTITSTVILGLIAYRASIDLQLKPEVHDIWQHVAAIEALMKNLSAPQNPYVIGISESRHFHPLWVAQATFNSSFGLTVWDGWVITTYVSMFLLGVSIFIFSQTMFSDEWAPLRLLLVFLLGWALQLSHTGFHSINSLLDGAAYPATFMTGLTLILWSLVIKGLSRPLFVSVLIPLVAFMFATHQLGAVIGLIGAAAFVLGHHGATFKHRVIVSLAILTGLGFSLLWPYYNPLQLMLSPGNSNWVGGPNLYGFTYLYGSLVPAFLGVLGLGTRRMRPIAIALLFYLCAYGVGLAGQQIAGRFLPAAVLVLHIGLAAYLPNILNLRGSRWERKSILYVSFISVVLIIFGLLSTLINWIKFKQTIPKVNLFIAAQELTVDIPDNEQIAAFDTSAWPVVATGQKVLSIPWPEPGIADLAVRQQAVDVLFDPMLTAEERRAQAQSLGVRTLITLEYLLSQETINILYQQAAYSRSEGKLLRFDLFE